MKGILILEGTLYLIFGMIVFSIFSAIPMMLLWNWLMPNIFGLCKIDFLQSCGLLLLSSLLFGNKSDTKTHRDKEDDQIPDASSKPSATSTID